MSRSKKFGVESCLHTIRFPKDSFDEYYMLRYGNLSDFHDKVVKLLLVELDKLRGGVGINK